MAGHWRYPGLISPVKVALFTTCLYFGAADVWYGGWWGWAGALILVACALRGAVLLREWRHDDEVATRWPLRHPHDTIHVMLVDDRYTPGPSDHTFLSDLPERPE